MRFSDQNDESLLQEASAGQFSGLEELLQRHQQRLLNFYWRMTGSENIARLLFEESWAELYKLRDSHAIASGVQTALFAIATRKAMKAIMADPGLGVKMGHLSGDPSSLPYRSARLNDAILGLPLNERAALLLSFFDSLNFKDTAACLNEREENARELAGSGLKRLLDGLGPEFLSGGLG